MKFLVFAVLLFSSIISQANELDLKKHSGKVIYLDFWASWCGPCKESFPWLNQIQKKYPNVKIIAVNLDKNKKDADKFLKKHPADFEVIYNPSASLAKIYKVKGMPYSVIFDKTGKEQFSHIGFSNKKSDQYIDEINSLLEKK
jgi:thiol-disulfide isomerase/thioredoxin